MQCGSVFIHIRCRLRADVSIRAIECERADGVIADRACEAGPAAHPFDCVTSHVFILRLMHCPFVCQGVLNLTLVTLHPRHGRSAESVIETG
jgi:hypothetical protein